MFGDKNIFYIKVFLAIILAVLICTVIIMSLVPPVSKDALVHHLNIPKLYLGHGGIYEIPTMPFSYYPMNLDLLYMIPLYFGNDIIPKLIHFVFALFTAWMIFSYLRRRLNELYALFGVLFFLSLPIIIKLSITVYVDLGLIFFTTASLLLLLKWIESGFRLKILILAGIFCGLALGTKYNGLVALFLLTLAVPFIYSRYFDGKRRGHSFLKPVFFCMIFFFTSLLVFSPWMIRNYKWTKNPIYPFYNSFFNPQVQPVKIQEQTDKTNEINKDGDNQRVNRGFFTYRSLVYKEKWWEIMLLPLRIFFQGKDGSSQYFDGRLNPFLLILPLIAFIGIREDSLVVRREKMVLGCFSVLFFAFAFFSSVLRIRYIAPIIPPLIILSAFGVNNLIRFGFKLHKHTENPLVTLTRQRTSVRLNGASYLSIKGAMVIILLVLTIALNALYIYDQFKKVDPFSYLGGNFNRDKYIEEYRHEYSSLQYINNKLPDNSLVLFIFLGKRGYYCNKNYIPDTTGQIQQLYYLFKNSEDPAKILTRLKERGITHLVIYDRIFDKWLRDSFSGEEKDKVTTFLKGHTKLLFRDKGVTVLGLQSVSL